MRDNFIKNCYKKILAADSVYDIAIVSPTQFAPKLSSKLSKKFSLNKIQSITDKDIKGLNNLLKSYNAKAIIVRPDRFILKTCKKVKDFNQIESLPL